jgi:two-component system OmpR family response regulator/two-component system copper resistance phosphate regulon response regulator CusR
MKILLVEDDELLGKSLQLGFSERAFDCRWVQQGLPAVQLVESEQFDVVVLDLMLPDISGLEVLGRLRGRENRLPVLILTALGSVDDRVRGLDCGADDYLVKPFAFVELVARLEALTRRVSAQVRLATELQAGPLTLDISTRCARRDGQEIELTTTEYKLLEFLIRNSDQTVTRRMLCEHLWDANWEGVTNVIEVHINRLRGKVDRGFRQPLIHTVRGIGYAFRTE